MWTCRRSLVIVFAIFATGSVTSESASNTDIVTMDAGYNLTLRVFTFPNTVVTCALITPKGESIELMPEDKTEDRYELMAPDPLYHCRVILKNIQQDDSGKWELKYTGYNNNDDNITGSQFYEITVTPQESSNETGTETNSINLPKIHYGARMDSNITITLSRKDYEEVYYLHTPQGDIVKLENNDIHGVLVYPTKTHFVSCRVVIGPMVESLLGTWTLCGKHIEGEVIYERCQPSQIEWAISNPSHDWASRTEINFDHPVHFGGVLSPAVQGSGTVKTCHVITPNGEDIAITTDSDYPGLERAVASNPNICRINIGEIDVNFLGDWILYGTFDSFLGFNVISQPMTFYLYDEDSPYSQAYNVTTLEQENYVVHLGDTFTVAVKSTGNTDSCEFILNTGEKYNQLHSNLPSAKISSSENGACHLLIGPVTSDILGRWTLIGKFNVNDVIFNELHLPFYIIEEDPSNPIEDDRYEPVYLNSQEMITSFGESSTFSIPANSVTATESCHLRTPDNKQYILRNDLNIEGVEVITSSNGACTVRLLVANEESIGSWTLIARVNRRNSLIEWRLPFTINVEEQVEAIPNATTVAEGMDLYLRLENPTQMYETCTLIGPVRSKATRDESLTETCGFIVRHVTPADSGTWEITYGFKAKYRAFIHVTVNDRFMLPETSFAWTKGESVNKVIGPEDVKYCRLETPSGLPIFEGFGLCHIILERVQDEHAGTWKMIVGRVGRVLSETHNFIVNVASPVTKAEVKTSVASEKPIVVLSCQVESEHAVIACKFRDPSGNILLAAQGVGEDRYSFYGNGVSFESNVTKHECGLRITNPVIEELGLWRCAVHTEGDTYYGFLSVLCPWAMRDPEVAEVVDSEPTLTTGLATVVSVEGDVTTMSCIIQSPIQYCYFRAQNGTIYNVNPSNAEWFMYAGAGFDAGECGIRFPSLQAADSGRWSCHVGFEDATKAEQRANIQLKVEALMVVSQQRMENQPDTLVIQSQVYELRTIEYCRFVRIDGLGFKSDHAPAGYEDYSLLTEGHCELRIQHPTILDMHPWTVVVKILGYDDEIARTTHHTLSEDHEPNPDVHPDEHPDGDHADHNINHKHHSSFALVWSFVMVISVSLFFIGILLGPKRNREWTYRRTVIMRDSFRRSFTKKPLEDVNFETKGTPNAA